MKEGSLSQCIGLKIGSSSANQRNNEKEIEAQDERSMPLANIDGEAEDGDFEDMLEVDVESEW